jgi:DNA polymerase III epsilon subunit-like protein
VPDFAFAFLDCEFGGLDPELHDITEIAVIVTDDRLAELASAEWKVRARAERITAEAAEISGWSAEAWAQARPLREVLSELAALLPAGRTVGRPGRTCAWTCSSWSAPTRPAASPGPSTTT